MDVVVVLYIGLRMYVTGCMQAGYMYCTNKGNKSIS